MKVLILDAGFATRLRPLTNKVPKSLLPFTKNTTILDKHLEKLSGTSDKVYIETNNRFSGILKEWVESSNKRDKIVIIDNGVSEESEIKGPFGDILYFIEHENIDDDLLIIGSDNLLVDESYQDIIKFFKKNNAMVAVVSTLEKTNMIRQENDTILAKDGTHIINFRHKASPPYISPYFASFIYLIPKAKLYLIKEYVKNMSYAPDPKEHFIGWAIKGGHDFFAYKLNGRRFDTGTIENYESAKKLYQNQKRCL